VSLARHLVPRFKITADVSRRDLEPIGQRASATHYIDVKSLFHPR
jgi:hypothetical protein